MMKSINSVKKVKQSTLLYNLLAVILISTAFLLIAYRLNTIPDTIRPTAFISNTVSETHIREIVANTKVTQSFVAEADNLSGFSLLLATYDRNNSSSQIISLVNADTLEVIEKWQINGQELQDNTYRDFNLSTPLEKVKGEKFNILVSSPNAKRGNAITISSTASDTYTKGTLYINNVAQPGDLTFKVFTLMTDYTNLIYMGTYFVFLSIVLLICVRRRLFGHFLRYFVHKTTQAVTYIKGKKIRFLCYLTMFAGLISSSFLSEYIISHFIIGTKNSNGAFFNLYRWMFVVSVYFLVFVFITLRKQIGQKPELLFLAISLTVGSLFAFSMPINTNVSWDDQIHFSRALDRSFVGDSSPTKADYTMISILMPKTFSLSEVEKQHALLNQQYNSAKIGASSKKSFLMIYRDTGYLPSSMMLFLGRILNVSYGIMFVLGRWANVIVYSWVVYFAIRKLITGKMILSVIALFPTAVFLASTYGYDSWVTCFTMLGMAYFLSEMQQPEKMITPKDAIIMMGSLVIGFGPKAIYFPILFLLFFISKKKFKKRSYYNKYRFALILSIIFVAASFILPVLIQGPGTGDLRGGTSVNPREQLRFILSNPLGYTKILLSFLMSYLSLEQSKGYMNLLVYLGIAENQLLLLITLAITVFTDKNENDLLTSGWKTKLPVSFVFLATVSLIATALYIDFTPVAQFEISGCQPRYLLPLLFPLLAVVGSGRIVNKTNRTHYNALIFGICSFVLLSGIWSVCISRYA